MLYRAKVDGDLGVKGCKIIGEFIKSVQNKKAIFEAQGIARNHLISKSCRVIDYLNGDKTIRLYATDIVQFKGNKIILSSGGYKTVTTKARMNQFIGSYGCYVYQQRGTWYVNYNRDNDNQTTQEIEFFDGIELPI